MYEQIARNKRRTFLILFFFVGLILAVAVAIDLLFGAGPWFIVLAPMIGYFMQMAMSRNREFLADASGVQLTRYPPGLISALEKLRNDQAVVHYATKATAQMWIEAPLETAPDNRSSKINKLFDTHPPLEERIQRLKEM